MTKSGLPLILFLSVIFIIQFALKMQIYGQVIGNQNINVEDCLYDEILIKFNDNVLVDIKTKRENVITGISSIDELFYNFGVISTNQIFLGEKKRDDLTIKINNQQVLLPQLFNFYQIKFRDKQDINYLIDIFSKDPSVEFAEPNYIFTTCATYPDDPLYQDGSQWYINVINAPSAWDSVKSDTNQVIAILDTGVDWDHPDLDDNIWTNWDDIPGNSSDDDGNGYVDDIRGWDWINNDNNPNDDNSHGTHVAGIAAAESNNGAGISGVAWGAKLMPLKVLQSSGRGSAGDIAAGINYARNNGATIINMSLGSYSESLTIKAALENAYSTCILAAAAGNDGYPISFLKMYPAGYQFVLGVQSSGTGGGMSGFSNYDTYPTTTDIYDAGLNYEIFAPGENIISTFPFGGYNNLNGTSMSTPMVSGAVALLKTYNPLMSNEEIFSRLIQGSGSGNLDIYSSLTMELVPILQFNDYTLKDTMPNCNNDGTVDDGETITISFEIENVGGWADSVYAQIELANQGDTVFAEILDSIAYIGDIGIYSTLNTDNDPFIIHIDTTTPYKQEIALNIRIKGKNTSGITQGISFEVTNAYEIKGILDSIMVLTPGILWVTDGGFMMDPGGGFEFKPGAHLIVVQGFSHTNGVFFGDGKPDSLILIEGELRHGTANFSYTHFLDGGFTQGTGTFNNCIIENSHLKFLGGNYQITDCQFVGGFYGGMTSQGTLTRCNFINTEGNITAWWAGNLNYHYCNFLGIDKSEPFFHHANPPGLVGNNFICREGTVVYGAFPNALELEVPDQYWGTTDPDKIDEMVWDFYENPSWAILRYEPVLPKPSDSAHGVIWKVEINGIDPQDEILDPLGSEWVKFDVYFNKCVDTSYTPLLTFGNHDPFDEHVVSDSACWSADSSIWTAWYNIGLETGDGTNVIKVSGAVDTAGWEIPPEFNNRFKFVIQAASAASVEFIALADLDRVDLEWPGANTNDVLGYNLYRMTKINDSTYSDSVLVNELLIMDTVFSDITVNSGTTYYYFYKVVGTDLLENDRSKIVSATPYSAEEGDANGDLSVDVLDITTVVSYILQQNPQPFYDYAADINDDQIINIIDVVGIIQLISGKAPVNSLGTHLRQSESALSIIDNQIILENQNELIAIQFELEKKTPETILLLLNAKGAEFSYSQNDEKLAGIIYNYYLNLLPAGLNNIINITEGQEDIKLLKATGVTSNNNVVDLIIENDDQMTDLFVKPIMVYPNPFKDYTNINFNLTENGIVQVSLFDLRGQYIKTIFNSCFSAGDHIISWECNKTENMGFSPGIYYFRFEFVPENKGGETINTIQKIVIIDK